MTVGPRPNRTRGQCCQPRHRRLVERTRLAVNCPRHPPKAMDVGNCQHDPPNDKVRWRLSSKVLTIAFVTGQCQRQHVAGAAASSGSTSRHGRRRRTHDRPPLGTRSRGKAANAAPRPPQTTPRPGGPRPWPQKSAGKRRRAARGAAVHRGRGDEPRRGQRGRTRCAGRSATQTSTQRAR